MNLELLIPVFSSILGRDLSKEYDLFKRSGVALNNSMNDNGRAFFRQNWPTTVDFMESPEGQDALKMFLELWAEWLAKRAITAQEVQAQAEKKPDPEEDRPVPDESTSA